MYLEIKDLTPEEAKEIKDTYGDRARLVYSIYHEVCRIEADCSLERVTSEENITLTEEEYENKINELADYIANACEDNAFQEMCEIADVITRENL